jgi:hypothetical protein
MSVLTLSILMVVKTLTPLHAAKLLQALAKICEIGWVGDFLVKHAAV